jgi:hypothetical protein
VIAFISLHCSLLSRRPKPYIGRGTCIEAHEHGFVKCKWLIISAY